MMLIFDNYGDFHDSVYHDGDYDDGDYDDGAHYDGVDCEADGTDQYRFPLGEAASSLAGLVGALSPSCSCSGKARSSSSLSSKSSPSSSLEAVHILAIQKVSSLGDILPLCGPIPPFGFCKNDCVLAIFARILNKETWNYDLPT